MVNNTLFGRANHHSHQTNAECLSKCTLCDGTHRPIILDDENVEK